MFFGREPQRRPERSDDRPLLRGGHSLQVFLVDVVELVDVEDGGFFDDLRQVERLQRELPVEYFDVVARGPQ